MSRLNKETSGPAIPKAHGPKDHESGDPRKPSVPFKGLLKRGYRYSYRYRCIDIDIDLDDRET